jgi:hypothetical protein
MADYKEIPAELYEKWSQSDIARHLTKINMEFGETAEASQEPS